MFRACKATFLFCFAESLYRQTLPPQMAPPIATVSAPGCPKLAAPSPLLAPHPLLSLCRSSVLRI
ncbi:hypothetical protein SCA6_007020 [Theobroma cacao]